MGHYCGPATLSDGVDECRHNVEVHARPGEDGIVPAWHVVIEGRLPRELRFPYGKALSVLLSDGRRGVGTLVDPQLIRGAGEPPCG